ncbi:hypothetical protein VP01_10g2 [Puccinia sorghi]|uniref:Uncharacterized protein n=1 Tax=Puccinia sorghi TaxID=27349 RepID=A0A0L6VSV2_9BASI|nr:hypothetical protein VP01_10g2 [Puccinia sorghi]
MKTTGRFLHNHTAPVLHDISFSLQFFPNSYPLSVNYKQAGPMAWMGKSHLLCQTDFCLSTSLRQWQTAQFYCCGVSRSHCLLNDPLVIAYGPLTQLKYISCLSCTVRKISLRRKDSREGGASYDCNIMSSCWADSRADSRYSGGPCRGCGLAVDQGESRAANEAVWCRGCPLSAELEPARPRWCKHTRRLIARVCVRSLVASCCPNQKCASISSTPGSDPLRFLLHAEQFAVCVHVLYNTLYTFEIPFLFLFGKGECGFSAIKRSSHFDIHYPAASSYQKAETTTRSGRLRKRLLCIIERGGDPTLQAKNGPLCESHEW